MLPGTSRSSSTAPLPPSPRLYPSPPSRGYPPNSAAVLNPGLPADLRRRFRPKCPETGGARTGRALGCQTRPAGEPPAYQGAGEVIRGGVRPLVGGVGWTLCSLPSFPAIACIRHAGPLRMPAPLCPSAPPPPASSHTKCRHRSWPTGRRGVGAVLLRMWGSSPKPSKGSRCSSLEKPSRSCSTPPSSPRSLLPSLPRHAGSGAPAPAAPSPIPLGFAKPSPVLSAVSSPAVCCFLRGASCLIAPPTPHRPPSPLSALNSLAHLLCGFLTLRGPHPPLCFQVTKRCKFLLEFADGEIAKVPPSQPASVPCLVRCR